MCTMSLKIPTGCNKIDEILEGGITSESVSLVYGEPETGKTTLSIQCAINCAKQGLKTLFIDCDGTFSVRRLSQIAANHTNEVAEQIILIKPQGFSEQIFAMDHLLEYASGNMGFLVVDTITTFYRLEIAEHPNKTFKINRELNRQMALLAQIAKTRKIAVLVTSQVRSVLDMEHSTVTEPVATRVLKFWADTIIALKPTEKPDVVKAVLEKSSKGKQPMTCYLKINAKGMHEHQL